MILSAHISKQNYNNDKKGNDSMKSFKKIAALLLVLIIAMSMTGAAFAEESGGGSITINGLSDGAVYKIYRLLDLESYNTSTGAYSYKVNSDWTNFFETEEAKTYISVDNAGYATWGGTSEEEAYVAVFAQLALKYAKENSIDPVKSSLNAGEFVIKNTTGVFSGLALGYYLIDSNMGALCGLTTTNPNASVNTKNGQPTIDKQVQEDSTAQWGGSNTADIGQTVEYRVTINVERGAEKYVLHDKMSAGLTFKEVSEIEHVIPQSDTHDVDASYYTVKTTGLTDDCTFEVEFDDEFCGKLQANDKVIVYYSAMLNRNAVIAGDGNSNVAWLEFGEEKYTTRDSTTTYTYGFDLVKTDSQNTLIDGAEFRIYDALTGGNEVKVVLMEDGITYRRARADEEGVSIEVKDGKVRVVGFDNGTYYLEETVAPEGYHQLTARQRFIISNGNQDAVFNDGIFSTGSGVHVVNKSGTMLPETGGIGTTIFYVIGGVLVAAAVVLLVTRKRMNEK